MGFRVSWLAVRESAHEHVLRTLGARAGETFGTETSEYFDFDMTGSVGRKGWYIVTFGTDGHRLFSSATLAALSEATELFACAISETVMYSDCENWRQGTRQWHVRHQAEKGINHLDAGGDYPQSRVARLSQNAIELRATNSRVDFMFDVPLLLAWRETGFMHDRGSRRSRHFVELISTAQPGAAATGKPKWKFW